MAKPGLQGCQNPSPFIPLGWCFALGWFWWTQQFCWKNGMPKMGSCGVKSPQNNWGGVTQRSLNDLVCYPCSAGYTDQYRLSHVLGNDRFQFRRSGMTIIPYTNHECLTSPCSTQILGLTNDSTAWRQRGVLHQGVVKVVLLRRCLRLPSLQGRIKPLGKVPGLSRKPLGIKLYFLATEKKCSLVLWSSAAAKTCENSAKFYQYQKWSTVHHSSLS